jgi:hypothetical protein
VEKLWRKDVKVKDDKLVKSWIPMAKKKVPNSRRANPE